MTPHVASNPYKEAARLRKAHKLADCAMAHGLPLDLLQEAGDDFWKTCAEQAGCNVPSPETVDLVISIIRSRTAGSDAPSRDGSGSPARTVAPATVDSVFADAAGEGEPEAGYTETGYDPFEGLDASPGPWSGLG